MSRIALRLLPGAAGAPVRSHVRVSAGQDVLHYRALGAAAEQSFAFDRVYGAAVARQFFVDEELRAMAGAVNVFLGPEPRGRFAEFVECVNAYID